MPVGAVKRLGYVGINASDLAAWRSYAVEVLGHEVTPDSDDHAVYLRMDDQHHRLVVHPSDEDDVAYIGWDVGDAEALTAMANALSDAGLDVHGPTGSELDVRRVLEFVRFTDPCSGVRMELFYGPQMLFLPPYSPRGRVSGYRTGDLGLGHVVVYVKDAESAAAFYEHTLGLRMSDWVIVKAVGFRAGFMHCNARHHSLAFMSHPDPPRRAHHVLFETLSLDDVGIAHDICKDRGEVTATLGRHVNDRMVSFYTRNPGNWHFELGWGGRDIDPATWRVQYYDGMQLRGGEWGHDGLMNIV